MSDQTRAEVFEQVRRVIAWEVSAQVGVERPVEQMPPLIAQAKVAWLSGASFRLKSGLKGQHRALLTRTKPLRIAGRDYSLTGRLALYQTEHGDSWYDYARSCPAWRHVSLTGLDDWPMAALVEDAAAQGYYTAVMSGAGASRAI